MNAVPVRALVRTSFRAYVVKSYGVVLGLFLFSVLVDAIATPVAALTVAAIAVSTLLTAVSARLLVFRKSAKAVSLVPDSLLARRNAHKTFGLVLAVAVPLVSITALLFDVPGWTRKERLTAILAIPAFWVAGLLVDRVAATQVAQPWLEGRATGCRSLMAALAVALVATAVFALVPHPGAGVPGGAYLEYLTQTRNGLVHSSSLLVSDTATIGAHISAVREHLSNTAAQGNFAVLSYALFIGQTALVALGIVGLLEFCRLPLQDFGRIFRPLRVHADAEPDAALSGPLNRGEIVTVIVTYLIPLGAVFVIDHQYGQHTALHELAGRIIAFLGRWA